MCHNRHGNQLSLCFHQWLDCSRQAANDKTTIVPLTDMFLPISNSISRCALRLSSRQSWKPHKLDDLYLLTSLTRPFYFDAFPHSPQKKCQNVPAISTTLLLSRATRPTLWEGAGRFYFPEYILVLLTGQRGTPVNTGKGSSSGEHEHRHRNTVDVTVSREPGDMWLSWRLHRWARDARNTTLPLSRPFAKARESWKVKRSTKRQRRLDSLRRPLSKVRLTAQCGKSDKSVLLRLILDFRNSKD